MPLKTKAYVWHFHPSQSQILSMIYKNGPTLPPQPIRDSLLLRPKKIPCCFVSFPGPKQFWHLVNLLKKWTID